MAKVQYMSSSADTEVGPSPSIWGNCPVHDMIEDPRTGVYYFEDYVSPIDPTTACGYTITQVTTGAIVMTDAVGGVLKVDAAGNATADDGVNAQVTGETWLPAVGKELWFEARVKMTDCATTPDQHFVGLSVTETALIAAGVLAVTGSLVGFYTDTGTTAGRISFGVIKATSADQTADLTAAAAVANATWVKLGFRIHTVANALQVTPYVNGVAFTAKTDTDDIPLTEMTLSYVAQVEQTSADAELHVDWVRIAQLR